jgi:hypothetical protein
MASHKIDISILNTPTGAALSSDGVMAIICHAAAVGTTFALDTGYLLTSASDLDTLGITDDGVYQNASDCEEIYQHVTEFYAEAGTGAKLWIVGVDDSTAYATFLASDDFKDIVRGFAASDYLNKAKGIAVGYRRPTAVQHAADFPTDVTASIPIFKTALESLFDEGYQCFGVIDGKNMSDTVTIANLGTRAGDGAYNVAVAIHSTQGNGIASIGLLLGRLARINVGVSCGKVDDGSLSLTNLVSNTATTQLGSMYLTNGIKIATGGTIVVGQTYLVVDDNVTYNSVTYAPGEYITAVNGFTTFSGDGYLVYKSTLVSSLTKTEVEALGNKQYVFCRKWDGKTGYFFNDGATCESISKQFNTIEYNRIANHLAEAAMIFFTDEIGKNLPVNSDGSLSLIYTAGKKSQYEKTYVVPKIQSNDISNASITITGDTFTSDRTLRFAIQILPSPALGNVIGTVEFVTTL